MTASLEDLEIVAGVERSRLATGVAIEPCPRWVRAYFGGVAVADSKRVLLAFEPKRLPVYWFPAQDVRMDLLTPARPGGSRPGGTARWILRVGERTAELAAWSYPDPGPERVALKDHIAFYWSKMDAWYEEDDEVFVHPRDPYSRVDVLHSSRRVRVELGGQLLAESTRPRLLFESGLPTRYYLPKQDVRMELLEPTATTTRCPYKGVAVYWSLRLGDQLVPDIVWSYPHPIPECSKIENLLCFFNERVDILVDGELQPRPVTEWSDRAD
jgi:uncharacterized protein (DUF427 family)